MSRAVLKLITVSIALAGLTACYTPLGLYPTNKPLPAGDTYTQLGRVSGEACRRTVYLLSIIPIPLSFSEGIGDAEKDALTPAANRGASALVDIAVDRDTFVLPLVVFDYVSSCTDISATAVRFVKQGTAGPAIDSPDASSAAAPPPTPQAAPQPKCDQTHWQGCGK